MLNWIREEATEPQWSHYPDIRLRGTIHIGVRWARTSWRQLRHVNLLQQYPNCHPVTSNDITNGIIMTFEPNDGVSW